MDGNPRQPLFKINIYPRATGALLVIFLVLPLFEGEDLIDVHVSLEQPSLRVYGTCDGGVFAFGCIRSC